jgi:predicted nucleic-acid-binding protein
MISFDTNVVLRLVVEDDPSQCERAATAFRSAVNGPGAFVAATVLVEVSWVLRVAFKLDRATIATALRGLVDTTGVTVEREAALRRALAAYEVGTADFSDYVILECSRDAGALPVVTFDDRFARTSDVVLVASG